MSTSGNARALMPVYRVCELFHVESERPQPEGQTGYLSHEGFNQVMATPPPRPVFEPRIQTLQRTLNELI